MDDVTLNRLISDLKHVQDHSRLTPEQLAIWQQNPENIARHEKRCQNLAQNGWDIHISGK